MNTVEKVERISTDFENGAGPFSSTTFPEERLLDELATDGEVVYRMSMEDKLAAISLFSTLDYNRDANQLVNKILEASEHDGLNVFNPHAVDKSKKGLEYLFEDISFRYPSRDAHAWHKNCHILVNEYNAKWHELLLDTGCDAVALVQRLNDDDFNCLKGVKIAPMYARIINDDVAPLSNVWDLEIPVDVHVRRLSQDLFDAPDMSDDVIREEWRGLAIEADIDRAVVDGGLWHIGNKWDEWGEEYWRKL